MMYFIKKDTLDNLAKSVQRVSFKEDYLTPIEMSESLDQIKVADHMLIDEGGYYPEHYLISGQILKDIAKAIDSGHEYTEGQMIVEDMERKISEALGYAEEKGKTQGIEEGKKSEYDRFWDAAQQNGNLVYYASSFAGKLWRDEIFRPKYNIKPKLANSIFQDSVLVDIKGCLEEAGVVLDTSQCTRLDLAFYYCQKLTRLPTIDCRVCTNLAGAFRITPKLVSIDNLIVHEGLKYENTFSGASSLKEIRINEGIDSIDGVSLGIGNDINFSPCPLSYESMVSIINALKEFLDGDVIYTRTIYFSEACKAILADNQYADDVPVWDNWLDFITNEKGWNVG